MQSRFSELTGADVPIVLAPMDGAVGPALAAEVSNAGGLGCLPLWNTSPEKLHKTVAKMQALSPKPFAVNLNMGMDQDALIDACLEAEVPVFSLFWGLSKNAIERCKSKGAVVMQTIGTAQEAQLAVDAGADILVAQGHEAGGHVWSQVGTMALVPAVVDAVGDVPVIAAGGIADGRGLAAAMMLGASGAWIGTRFLASAEVEIHPEFQHRLLEATEGDTAYFTDLFDIGWPDAPHRVLKNSTIQSWKAAGQPKNGSRPGEGDTIGKDAAGRETVRYHCHTPRPGDQGQIEAMSMWAGQGLAMVNNVQPAAQILHEISRDAARLLGRSL